MRGRRSGSERARRRLELGVGLFVEDGAYTTVASAVSILVVLALTFSAAGAAWSLSRAGDVQAASDTTALAGANVVSSYHTAATVVDASLFSLSLTGLCVTGAGMVGLLVPGMGAAAGEAVRAGVKILDTRNEFAASASKGLQALERALPFLVAANATRTCAALGTDAVGLGGTALAVPSESASEFPAVEEEQVPTEGLEGAAEGLDEAARELQRAAEETEAAKRRAWEADCGGANGNMRERAASLSGLSAAQNPAYASSVTWRPQVGLDRARAYYRWRRDNEAPEGSGAEAKADSAARRAFYAFALEELERAGIVEADGHVSHTVPLLPRNTEDVKRTRLYTDATWPTTGEPAGRTLHYGADCPGARGASAGRAALRDIDAGAVRECDTCRFSVGDLGKTPAASTTMNNGFEHHLRRFTEALDEYVSARNEEMELERRARGEADRAGDAFEEALGRLSGKRPRIAPPGRYGCVAFVASGEIDTPAELGTDFSETPSLTRRGAVSAAVLAPDSSGGDNVLASFFSSLEERSGSTTVVALVGDVMDLWGRLLMGYGDLSDDLDELGKRLFSGMDALGAGSIARILGDRVGGAVSALGLEPVDVRSRKPVLTDTSNVARDSGSDALARAQEALRSVPLASTDPQDYLAAAGYRVESYLAEAHLTIAEIPIPGGGSIPLTVRVQDLAGMS